MLNSVSHIALSRLLDFWRDESGASLVFTLNAPAVHEGTITVAVKRSHDEIGPEGVGFSVTDWTGFDTAGPTANGFNARLHDIDYLWSFGDPGSTFSPVRVLSHMQDANVAYGPDVGHVYGPGTYTWSCLAIERSSGKTAYAEGSLTVKDPDTEFSGTQTLYVSNTSTFGDKPTGAVEYTDLATAVNACKGLSAGSKRRVMLRRGETHTLSADIDGDGVWPTAFYLCAQSGAGAKPIVNYTVSAKESGVIDRMRIMDRPSVSDKIAFRIDGIDWRGPWNPDTESGLDSDAITGHGLLNMNEDSPSRALPEGIPEYVLVTNCEISGFGTPLWLGNSITTRPLRFVHNTNMSNWRDYAIFGGPGDNALYLLGVDTRQSPDALGGSDTGSSGSHNRHGPYRLAGEANGSIFVMDGCDSASTVGWFPNINGYNTHQPCLRLWFVYQTTNGLCRANIRRSIFEGGNTVIGIGDQDGNGGPLTANTIVAQNILIASHMTNDFILVQWRGTTIENNIFITPNVPFINGIYNNSKVVTIRTAGNAGSASERILAWHNTWVNLKTTANGGQEWPFFSFQDSVSAPEAVEEHNITHFPAIDTPVVPFAPLTLTNTIAPHVKGYRRRREVWTGTFASNVANGGTFTVPYTGGSFYSEDPGSSTAYQTTTPDHQMSVAGDDRTLTVSFGATEATITNTSGVTWSSGQAYVLQLERNIDNLPPVLTQYATPALNLGVVTPATGSAAIGGAATTFPRFDAISGNRKTIIDALTRTAATDGAVEVALES